MPRKTGEPYETRNEIRLVPRLEAPAQLEKRTGRKPKLKYPPLPQEIMDAMTDLERMHFEYFIEAIMQDNKLRASDYIGLYAAGLEYVAYLRLQASQMATGELVTMSRQHPGVQLRAWLDTMSFSRRKSEPKGQENKMESALMALSN